MAKEMKFIDINNLMLDTENARYTGDIVGSQREAITKLLEHLGPKIFKLAEHIAQHGLSPADNILAFPSSTGSGKNKQFIVAEGNRRLLAIKLLHNPDLAISNTYRRKIESITTREIKKSLATIEFSALPSRQETNVWVDLKHTGENDGAGIVPWGGAEKDARRVLLGEKKSVGRQVLDYIETDKQFPSDLRNKVNDIGITNLSRFFQGKPAQKAFGLSKSNGLLESSIPLDQFRDIAEYAVTLMLDDDFSVKSIYTSKDQENFIKDNIPPVILPKTDSYLDKNEKWKLSSFEPKTLSKKQKHGNDKKGKPRVPSIRSIRPSSDRKHLIDFKLRIEEKRINDIYHELHKILDVKKTPNAVSVLFRVFLELTVDFYIKKNKVKKKNGNAFNNRNDSLSLRVQEICDLLLSQGALEKNEAKTIRKLTSNNHSVLSVDTFNQYVHTEKHTPISTNLNIMMDNLSPFFKAAWK